MILFGGQLSLTHTHTHTHIHTRTCTHPYPGICNYTHLNCLPQCILLFIRLCLVSCNDTHLHTHKHTHTNTHIHTHAYIFIVHFNITYNKVPSPVLEVGEKCKLSRWQALRTRAINIKTDRIRLAFSARRLSCLVSHPARLQFIDRSLYPSLLSSLSPFPFSSILYILLCLSFYPPLFLLLPLSFHCVSLSSSQGSRSALLAWETLIYIAKSISSIIRYNIRCDIITAQIQRNTIKLSKNTVIYYFKYEYTVKSKTIIYQIM